MLTTAPITLSSADGASTLGLWLEDGAPCLRLSRSGRDVVSCARLRGLPAVPARPGKAAGAAAAPRTEPGGGLRLALPGGASVRAEVSGRDAFRVAVTGAADDGPGSAVALEIELQELGPVFGLGHLMAQHWPLQEGCLELGPFYPFDNGPNGVCTMAVPTVVAASGVAIVCDETETRCLHIALNASAAHVRPDSAKGLPSSMALKWGVGVANFDRKILPASAHNRAGDGLFTLQSRAEYDWNHVLHPWLFDTKQSSTYDHSPAVVNESVEDDISPAMITTSGARTTTIKDSAAIDKTALSNTSYPPALTFTIGAQDDVKLATEQFVLKRLRDIHPSGRSIPPVAMMRDPIWTTWARFKDSVDQQSVLNFAHDIAVVHALPHSIMEIDDRWSVKYGDLEFDMAKFPDPQAMVARLHALDFLVTLWVIPFANLDSEAVTNPATRGYFVKDVTGDVGGFAWWQPTKVAALDVTNDEACEWFLSKLRRMQLEYGIDGFKFDAGEPCFLPPGCVPHKPLKCPSDYTRAWISKVVGKFEVSECRAAVSGTEGCPPLLRLFDRFSTWGLSNGLASVITAMLTASVLGYPFVLPDMIGGNAYDGVEPDAELMVRWAQATSAMPSMQFSIPPWDHGADCAALCAAALAWRTRVFWPVLAELHADAARGFAPLTRPMWWAAPGNTGRCADALCVADQFMLGDDVVVAPVVAQGATSRRAFLPAGRWRRARLDANCASPFAQAGRDHEAAAQAVLCERDIVDGPCWLEDVPAPLSDMPVWIRAEKARQ